MKRTALLTAAALVAAPFATLLAAAPATADTSKRGVCAQGTYELQVDREDAEDGGGFEVGVDLDRLAPGSSWTVVVKHDGKRAVKTSRVADSEGDLEVDVQRPDTSGKDTFRFRAVPAGGGSTCAAAITVA
jgi:hypothetical protein